MRRALTALLIGAALLAIPSQASGVSTKTTRFIAGFEGFVSCPYADPAGHATIGYGHLLHLGGPTKKDRRKWGCISVGRGLKLLRRDLKATENEVLRRVTGARVTSPMITALTSFAFNLGAGALDRTRHKGSGRVTRIALNVRRGKYLKAGREMLLYDGIIVGGRRIELEGLRIRRRQEYRLMEQGVRRLKSCKSGCAQSGSNNESSGGLAPG